MILLPVGAQPSRQKNGRETDTQVDRWAQEERERMRATEGKKETKRTRDSYQRTERLVKDEQAKYDQTLAKSNW